MKKIALLLLAAAMILTLAVGASAFFEAEEAFGEVKFEIGKQSVAWNPDGTITDGEYYKVDIKPEWLSYAINDNDTDAGLEYAKATMPELYMSWDETYVYAATRYTVTEGHENLWDGDPASMWYSGAVQFNYANFDEVASEYRLEYGVGLSSDTGDTLYTVWADGVGNGYEPTQDDARVWIDGNTLTYETRVPWEAFADEDNTGYKEGNGFNTTFVWSIGKGQDYVHIQLAEGCTGAGKHAENMAQVTLVGAVASTPSILPYQMEEYGQKSSDVYKVATTPTVDGVVTEGEYGDPITVFNLGDEGTLTKFVELTEDELKKVVPDDCTVYMTYDDTYLYLAVTCIDDSHMTPLSGTGIWDGDYLEFDLTRVSDDFADHSNRVCFALGIDNNGGICGYFDKAPDYADGSYSGVVWQDENDKAMVTLNDNLVTYETKFDWKGILGSEGAPESALYYVQICCSDEELYEKSEYEAYLGRLQNTPTMSDEVKAEIEGLGGKYIYNVLNFAGDAPVAAPTYTYPASGAGDNIITGTVIGNETGWGGSETAGRAAAFDGDPATFFDPLGVGDGFCGIDAGESYILDKAVILSRDGFNDRFDGAKIQGSNDGENWVTLWTSEAQGTFPDYYTVTEFENNTGYSQFRYFNDKNHGDVAEVEFYGAPGKVEPAPGFATADEAVESIGKAAISGYEFTVGSEGAFGGEGPENLWDGDTGTKLCTNTLPASSAAKLDDTYAIDGVVIALANDNAEYGRIPTSWILSGSNDGENWTEITTGDDTMFVKENSNYRYFAKSFDASPAYGYVKIEIPTSTDDIVQISEVVLTGAKAATPAAAADEKLDQKAEAPNTFDFGIVAAVAAVISLGGFAVSKKRK